MDHPSGSGLPWPMVQWLPAKLSPFGRCNLLADGGCVVFVEMNHTINVRTKVRRHRRPRAIARSVSVFAMAGVRWMGSTGELHAS